MREKSRQARRLVVVFATLSILSACAIPVREAKTASSSRTIVEQYLAALNRRDLLMLTAYVAPDVEWYSVVKGERILEVAGREPLAQMLTRYFEQHRRTRWTIEQSNASGNFLAVTERSEWDEDGATDSRESLCVYELSDGRIRRMTYFLIAP